MKIGIDGRLWNETGVGRYIRNVVDELSKQDLDNSYVIFLTKHDFETVSLPTNFKKIATNIHWHSLLEQTLLPILYLRENLDLLFVPHFNVPIFYPKKFIVTIHDLTVLRVRTGKVTTLPYPVYLVKYLAAFVAYFVAVKRSQKIFTVSNFVKNDIVKTFGVNPRKIAITSNAVDESFYPRNDDEVNLTLKKYKINKPYLFYVGNAHPHKNLERLVRAFEIVAKNRPNLLLVLGGKKNFFYERLERECRNMSVFPQLVFTGFVEDFDLPALYSGAEAYVSPSLYEGFGIQLLEAFACGCKVICSNTTSLPEIGGDRASYFNPYDIQDMAKKIERGADPDFHQDDGRRSQDDGAKNQKNDFSWAKSAKIILDVVKSL